MLAGLYLVSRRTELKYSSLTGRAQLANSGRALHCAVPFHIRFPPDLSPSPSPSFPRRLQTRVTACGMFGMLIGQFSAIPRLVAIFGCLSPPQASSVPFFLPPASPCKVRKSNLCSMCRVLRIEGKLSASASPQIHPSPFDASFRENMTFFCCAESLAKFDACEGLSSKFQRDFWLQGKPSLGFCLRSHVFESDVL